MTRRALAVILLGLLATASATGQEPAPGPDGAPDPRPIVGPPRAQPVSGAALERRAKEVAALLRCPVCQGLSVGDSPSSMAVHMRHQVADLLAAGYDEDQILRYFEASYGEFVRLKPPLRGVNWLVWLAPILGLLSGAALVGWTLRRPRETPPGGPAADLPGPETLPDDPALAAHVRRVRELAYGWPGGVRPPGAAS